MKWTREAIVWKLGLLGAVCGHLAAHTTLVPASWAPVLEDLSNLIALVCAYLGASPLPFGGGRRPFTLNLNGKDS